jgi:tetratricopeptide (TPR) repeat protein
LRRPLELFGEALDGYRRSGDEVGAQQTLRFIGQTHLDLGDGDAAVATLREAERAARDLGEARVLAPTLYWIGYAHLARGDLPAAGEAFDEVLAGGQAHALHGLGDLALAAGDAGLARERLDRAGALAAEGADAVLVGRIWLSLAALDPGGTAALLRALSAFRSCGAVHLEAQTLVALADAYRKSGLHDLAARTRAQVAAVYDTAGVPLSDRRPA